MFLFDRIFMVQSILLYTTEDTSRENKHYFIYQCRHLGPTLKGDAFPALLIFFDLP